MNFLLRKESRRGKLNFWQLLFHSYKNQSICLLSKSIGWFLLHENIVRLWFKKKKEVFSRNFQAFSEVQKKY